MLYVKLLKADAKANDVAAKINDWIDLARDRYSGFTVISITIQHLEMKSGDDWSCAAVIEYRNDTAIKE